MCVGAMDACCVLLSCGVLLLCCNCVVSSWLMVVVDGCC